MDSLILTALAKSLTKQAKKARESLSSGDHEVEGEITLFYKGDVTVLPDETYTPTADIPLKVALALFVRYSGITRDAAMEALIKAMKKALEIEELKGKDKKLAVEAIREIADLDEAEETMRAGLDKLPLKDRKGKVLAKVAVNEVIRFQEQEAA
jgi:hypothetical protein